MSILPLGFAAGHLTASADFSEGCAVSLSSQLLALAPTFTENLQALQDADFRFRVETYYAAWW